MPCCVEKIKPHINVVENNNSYEIEINRSPNRGDYFFRKLQQMEYVEKICEVADELFHLIDCGCERLVQMHHGLHEIEHFLHSCCVLNDILRIATGKFIIYQKGKFLFLKTVGRISLTASHFFYSINYIAEFKEQLVVKKIYVSFLSSSGHLLWSISMLWNRNKEHHLVSRLSIHVTAFLFDAIPLCKDIPILSDYTKIIEKITSLVGIIHALLVIHHIGPKNVEKYRVNKI